MVKNTYPLLWRGKCMYNVKLTQWLAIDGCIQVECGQKKWFVHKRLSKDNLLENKSIIYNQEEKLSNLPVKI
jgi:hypothetical protein